MAVMHSFLISLTGGFMLAWGSLVDLVVQVGTQILMKLEKERWYGTALSFSPVGY